MRWQDERNSEKLKGLVLCGLVVSSLATIPAQAKQRTPAQVQRTPAQINSPGSQKPGSEGSSGAQPLIGTNNIPFADAQPEDITEENYPDLIESFDYNNADIKDIAKAISELTGKNFIIDPNVRGNVSIVAPTRISVAEAYRAFLSALAVHGFTVVPSGKFLKIMQSRKAQRQNIQTYSGNYFPNTDQFITKVHQLKYISAADVQRYLRQLQSPDGGEVNFYEPTNTIIMTDYGTNIERIMSIITRLDVPGFEEQLEVIRIKYARAKDIADLIQKIINKDAGDSQGGRFSPNVPRFRRPPPGGGPESGSGGSQDSPSLVLPDERTNSIIVVGNKGGIARFRELVSRLDTPVRPEDWGGVHVYYVKHGEAEKIATALTGIAQSSNQQNQRGGGGPSPIPPPPSFGARPGGEDSAGAVFGGEVKISHDKTTNSLLITASKQDYEVVKSILAKIDIPRDSVFVEAIIVEMLSQPGFDWGSAVYKFTAAEGSGGEPGPPVGRIGFGSEDSLGQILNPATPGAILGFATGGLMRIALPGQSPVDVKDTLGFIRFLQKKTELNVLSTPQVIALNNEEAEIEVGEKVPVQSSTSTAANGQTTNSVSREPATIKLKITPFISPDSEIVRLKYDQKISQLSQTEVKAVRLQESAVATSERNLTTQIVVHNGDTAVLGGLMRDSESVSESKVPVLGDIPLLGWLFKSRSVRNDKINLTVFLTPKIIRNPTQSAELLDRKLGERIDFIQKNMKGRDPFGHRMQNLPRAALGSAGKGETLPGDDVEDSLAPEESPGREEAPNGDDSTSSDEAPIPEEAPAKETF